LSVSLIPYIFIMIYMGNTFEKTYFTKTQQEMKTQLDITQQTIEQYLSTIQRDMLFMSTLDVMNDIYSQDVDRRITHLLINKKKDLKLDGNFFVIDNKNTIIASSKKISLLTKYNQTPFFTQEIYSTFDKTKIATLVLDFSLQNISNLFNNSKERHYYIIRNKKEILFKNDSFTSKINVQKTLNTKPSIEIVLEQNQENFLTLLENYKRWFIIALVLGAIVIAFIALYFINRLIKPILMLSTATDEITNKQDYTYQVPVISNDEIGTLSKAFNKLITSMNNALVQLKIEAKNREELIEEKGKNEVLKELSTKLSRYLSPQIYQSIFEGKQDVTLTSKRKKLTIFFSDIVGFTETTDTMESEDLSELLNDYLDKMTIIALKHGATIDKYIGDSIMIFFGDPYTKGVQQDALACVNMALEMQDHMEILHQKWKEKGFTKPFQIRMGIHTGYCTVGNFGSQERLEYTIIGSSVNLASRIESAANPNEILISEETKLLVDDTFSCKQQKKILPKGFKRSVALYTVKTQTHNLSKHTIEVKTNSQWVTTDDINSLSLKEKTNLKKSLNTFLDAL